MCVLCGLPLDGLTVGCKAAGFDLCGVQRIAPLADHVEAGLLEDRHAFRPIKHSSSATQTGPPRKNSGILV